jgi:Bacterial Ig domain
VRLGRTLASRRRRRVGFGALAAALLVSSSVLAFGPLDDVHLANASAKQATQSGATGGVNPATNFPEWFQDSDGTTLQLCTANNDVLGMCLFAKPDAGVSNYDYQLQTGFADEAFYWMAQGALDIPTSPECPDCRRGFVEMSLEAAYTTGDPVPNQEFVFGRLRIWIDTPYKGHYKVTYPFGVEEFDADPGVKGIKSTIDTGTSWPDYSGPLRTDSKIRNFLVWDPAFAPLAPPGYIGDPGIDHEVKGATHFELNPATGKYEPFNAVRVELVSCAADAPTCPPNGFVASTNKFSVQGLLSNSVVPTPLTAQRATFYAATAASPATVNVFAQSLTGSAVSVSFDGGATSTPLTEGKPGAFTANVPVAAMPATAVITATASGGSTPTTLTASVTDDVKITNATYNPNVQDGQLVVSATSSAQGAAVPPTLTLFGIEYDLTPDVVPGTNYYTATINGLPPSSTLQVTSSLGGKAITNLAPIAAPPAPPPPSSNLPPVAVDDQVSTAIMTPVVVPVATNDSDPDSALDLNTVVIVQGPNPALGSIGAIGPSGVGYIPKAAFVAGSDSFTYTIADTAGARSNVATATVTVQPEQLIPALQQWNTKTGQWRIRGTSDATVNNTITAYLAGPSHAQPVKIGDAVVDTLKNYDICTACNKGGTFVAAGPRPAPGDTVLLVSSYGTQVPNNAITPK